MHAAQVASGTAVGILGHAGLDAAPHLSLSMPSPFARLVASGGLKHVIVPVCTSRSKLAKICRVPNEVASWLLPQDLGLPAAGADVDADAMHAEEVLGFAELARALRQIIATEGFQQLPPNDRVLYGKVVTHLERLQVSSLDRGDVTEVVGNIWQFKMIHLLKCVFLSIRLKDWVSFRHTVLTCLAVTVKPDMLAIMEKLLEGHVAGVEPSRGSLYGHRLSLDVGWMLWLRGEHERLRASPYVTFFGIDKSPQGKLDYLMGHCNRISCLDLTKIYDIVCALSADMLGDVDCSVSDLVKCDHVAFLVVTLRQHTLTPVVVAPANSGAASTLKAWVWSLFVEAGKEGVTSDLSSICALTSDMGEATLASFGHVDAYDLFPFMRPGAGASEGEGGPDRGEPPEAEHEDGAGAPADLGDMPTLIDFDPDDVDDCFNFVSAPAGLPCGEDDLPELIEMPLPDPDAFEWVEDPSLAVDGGIAAEPEPVGDDGGRGWSFDMSGCLHIPGMRHVIDNAASCMNTAMGDEWSVFTKGLTAVCNVCRKPFLRDRLKATCFSTSPASDSWHLFHGFKSCVYEARWSSASQAALELQPLMVPLRFAWELEKWNLSGKLPQPTPETKWRTDSIHLDETIRSDLFWATLQLACRLAEIIEGMVVFVSSCPCHVCKSSFHDFVVEYKEVLEAKGCKLKQHNCPMNGRVVPEIVAGEFDVHVQDLCRKQNASLRMDPLVTKLLAAQQVSLLVMFDRGSEASCRPSNGKGKQNDNNKRKYKKHKLKQQNKQSRHCFSM